GGTCIETLHSRHNDKNFVLFAESIDSIPYRRQILFVRAISGRARIVEINGTVMTLFISPGEPPHHEFPNGCLNRPLEGINRANHQHSRVAIPARVTQSFT